MAGLFNTGDSSDFEIHCGGEVFRVHRLMLKTRSEYFRALFDGNGFVENSEGFLKLTDVDPAVMETLLAILYTHDCDLSLLVDSKSFEDRKVKAVSTTPYETRAETLTDVRREEANDILKACSAVSSLADRFLCKGIDNVVVDKILAPQLTNHSSPILYSHWPKLYATLSQIFDNAGRGQSDVAQTRITEYICDRFYWLPNHLGCADIFQEILQHTNLMAAIARELLLGRIRVRCPTCLHIRRLHRPKAGEYGHVGETICPHCKSATDVVEAMAFWQMLKGSSAVDPK